MGYSDAHRHHSQHAMEWSQRSYRGGSGSGILGGQLNPTLSLTIEIYEGLDPKSRVAIRVSPKTLCEGCTIPVSISEPELAKKVQNIIRQPLINYCRQHGVTITPADVNELAIREATDGRWIQIFTDAPPVPYFSNRFLAAPRKKTDVGPVLRVPNKVQFFGLVLSEPLMSELRAKQEAEFMGEMNSVNRAQPERQPTSSKSHTSWRSSPDSTPPTTTSKKEKKPNQKRRRLPSPEPNDSSEEEAQLPQNVIPPKKSRTDQVIGTARRPIEIDFSDDDHGASKTSKKSSATTTTSTSTFTSEQRARRHFVPLDAVSISRAFQEGGAELKKSEIKDIGQLISESILFFPLPQKTFPELSKNPTQLILISIQPNGGHFHAHLAYNPDPRVRLGKGGFKTAVAAALEFDGTRKPLTGLGSSTINNSQAIDVALKRPFVDMNINSSKTRGSSKKKESRLSLPEEQQAISGEARLLVWANALLEYTYDFIHAKKDLLIKNTDPKNIPPYIDEMPAFRFVEAAVAIATKDVEIGSSKKPTSHRAVYLLEEMLPGVPSDFVKYIHNAEAVSLLQPDEPDYHLAEFLVFTQHVQFQITHKQAYISDLQGVDTTLTDPQIMTAPHLGADLFGDGNVGHAFEKFPQEHSCNHYCQWFQLDNLKDQD